MTTTQQVAGLIAANTDLKEYYEGHKAAMDGRVAAAQVQFDAWRKDRDTLGKLGEHGSRRMAVFQGYVSATNSATATKTGHFAMVGAVTNAAQNNNVYLHLKTHMRTDQHIQMFYYELGGQAYGESSTIDAKITGYCHGQRNVLINVDAAGTHGITAYEGSDKHIYLRLKFASTYVLTLTVDAMRVGNGVLPEARSLTPIFSTQETL